MTYFIGDHPCKLDGKGRILFPSALKKQVDGDSYRFVVKKDLFEKCLVLYTMEEWQRQNELIKGKINPFNKEHNQFSRGFHRGTAEVMLDNSNRLLIPKRLLDEVNIDKEVVLAGQDVKIEIWDKAAYESMAQDEAEFASLAEKIMQGTVNGEE